VRKISIPAALSACLIASAAQGQIRPGWEAFAARFDGRAPIVVAGEVTSVDWAHGVGPKVFLTLSSDDGGGASSSWTIEGNFTDTMQAQGFNKDNLKAGAHVSVRGYLAKDGSHLVNLREMTFADGRRLLVGLSR
jgi:hypothetical protein